jgi:hypothetical protein
MKRAYIYVCVLGIDIVICIKCANIFLFVQNTIYNTQTLAQMNICD